MLTVTDSACALMADLLKSIDAPDGMALRLTPADEGKLGLLPDQPGELDNSYEHEGKTVCIIAPNVANMLGKATIDAVDRGEGPQLTIRPDEGLP